MRDEKGSAEDAGLLLFIALFLLVAGAIGGAVQENMGNTPNKDQRIQAICDYLDAEKQGEVCVDGDKIVYEYKKVNHE